MLTHFLKFKEKCALQLYQILLLNNKILALFLHLIVLFGFRVKLRMQIAFYVSKSKHFITLYISIYQSMLYLYIFPSFHLSTYNIIYLFYPSMLNLSVLLSIYLSILYIFIYLSIHLSVPVSVSPLEELQVIKKGVADIQKDRVRSIIIRFKM